MFLKREYPVGQEWGQRGGVGVRRRLNSAQEAVLNFRIGHPAGIPLAIPPVASPAYPVVNPVPDKGGHNNKSKHQRPWHVHQCCNMQGCTGFDIRLAMMNKHHGIQSKVGQAVFSDEALPRCRLNLAEHDIRARVSPDHKLHACAAEIAHTIEQYYGLVLQCVLIDTD